MDPRPILLLSGPVGAGKTTVAHELVRLTDTPLVCIEGDRFWFFIKNPSESKRGEHFKMIMRAMVAAAVPYALGGHEVILDFSTPPWFLETAMKIAGLRNVPLDYVVLKPGIEVCAARAAQRKEGAIHDYESLKDLYHDFDGLQKHTIEEEQDASQMAALIRDNWTKGRYRL